MLDVSVKGATRMAKYLKAESKAQKKDLSTAIKAAGFRLMKMLKSQIRQGAPGGKRFAALSFMARYNWGRRRNNPLTRLAIGIRYYVPRKEDPEFHFGWVGPKVSKSWKYLAEKLQEGFTTQVSPDMRSWLGKRALSPNVPEKYRPYFKISRHRRTFTTPARPILDPFWKMSRSTAMRNIESNFIRKRRGERI